MRNVQIICPSVRSPFKFLLSSLCACHFPFFTKEKIKFAHVEQCFARCAYYYKIARKIDKQNWHLCKGKVLTTILRNVETVVANNHNRKEINEVYAYNILYIFARMTPPPTFIFLLYFVPDYVLIHIFFPVMY